MNQAINQSEPNTRTAGGTPRDNGYWIRPVAGLVAALYFVVVVIAWIAVVLAGDDGIVRSPTLQHSPNGYTIVQVQLNGPTDRANLRPGDVILAVNRVSTSDFSAYHKAVHTLRSGDSVTLRVQRASVNSAEDVVITLQPRLAGQNVLADLISLNIVGLLFMTVAVLVALARPSDPAARLLFVGAGSLALSQAAAMLTYGVHMNWVDKLEAWAFRLACAAALHLFLSFPMPHPLLTRLRAIGPNPLRRVGGGTALLYVVLLGVALVAEVGSPSVAPWWFLFLAAWLTAALLALIDNYRRLPSARARAQLKWILWATAISVLAFTLWLIAGVLPRAIMLAATACFPVAVGFAILRYRLFDIDIIIRRTLIYGLLTAALALVYLGSVILLQQIFRALTGEGSTLAVVVSTLAIAALFNPLRRLIQNDIDRHFYRRKYDVGQMLAAFAAAARDEVDLDRLTDALLTVVQETMQPRHVSLWLQESGTHKRAT